MSFLKIAVSCIALLFAGCILVPSPFSAQLDPVADRYSSIKRGTSRAEIEAHLGPATTKVDNGTSVWETRYDELNYVRLKVTFDGRETARSIEFTRAHGKSTVTPISNQRSAAVTSWSR